MVAHKNDKYALLQSLSMEYHNDNEMVLLYPSDEYSSWHLGLWLLARVGLPCLYVWSLPDIVLLVKYHIEHVSREMIYENINTLINIFIDILFEE